MLTLARTTAGRFCACGNNVHMSDYFALLISAVCVTEVRGTRYSRGVINMLDAGGVAGGRAADRAAGQLAYAPLNHRAVCLRAHAGANHFVTVRTLSEWTFSSSSSRSTT
jgi:hypothetical protein